MLAWCEQEEIVECIVLRDALGDVMDGCGLMRPGRLQNLSLLNRSKSLVYLYPTVRLVATETTVHKSGTKPMLHMV